MNEYMRRLVDSVTLKAPSDLLGPEQNAITGPKNIRNYYLPKLLGLGENDLKNEQKAGFPYEKLSEEQKQNPYLKLFSFCREVKEAILNELDETKNGQQRLVLFDGDFSLTIDSLDTYTTEFFRMLTVDEGNLTISEKGSEKKPPSPKTIANRFKIFAHFLFRVCLNNRIAFPLPKYGGKPENERDLYNLLTSLETTQKIARWTDIFPMPDTPDPNNLLFYLFDLRKPEEELSNDNLKQTIKKLTSTWFDLPLSETQLKKTKEKERAAFLVNKYAAPLIHEALRHPLYQHLFGMDDRLASPITHMKDVRELLSSTVFVGTSEEPKPIVQSPVLKILDMLTDEALRMARNSSHTAREYLETLGELALQTTERPYFIPEAAFEKLDEEIRNMLMKPGMRLLAEGTAPGTWKFHNRAIRMVCSAYAVALKINASSDAAKSIEIAIKNIDDRIENYFHVNELVFLDQEFHQYGDAIVFFSIGLLACTDYGKREEILKDILGILRDFSVSKRRRQIIYIYLAVNLRATSEIMISSDLRRQLFWATYGKTIYPFEMQLWKPLIGTSRYYENEIQNMLFSIENKNNLTAMFAFIYGQLDSAEKHDYTDAQRFLIDCSKLQWQTFDQVNKADATKLKAINELFKTGEMLLKSVYIDNKNTPQSFEVGLGIQLLCYALNDLWNLENAEENAGPLRTAVKDIARKKYETILLSDYSCRKNTRGYTGKGNPNDVFLLCGTYRITSSLTTESGKEFSPSIVMLPEEIVSDYRKWLRNERDKAGNVRFTLLLSRALSRTNLADGENRDLAFSSLLKKYWKDSQNISEYFLPYDNMNAYAKPLNDEKLAKKKIPYYSD